MVALEEDTTQNCDVCVEMSSFTTQLNSHHNGLQIIYVKIYWVSCRLLTVRACVCVCVCEYVYVYAHVRMWAKHAAAFMAECKVHNRGFSAGTVTILRTKQQKFNFRRGERERGSETKVFIVLVP